MDYRLPLNPQIRMAAEQNALLEKQNKLAQAETAHEACKIIVEMLRSFEEQLDQDHELALSLVSFGQSITFHVTGLAAPNPKLITFVGVTEDGRPIQLLQHVSQLSFLLMAGRKLQEKPRRLFGFQSDDPPTA